MENKKHKPIKVMAAHFVTKYLLQIIIYFALFSIVMYDSITGLIIYSIIIHLLVIALILALYNAALITEHLISYKGLIFMFLEGIVFASILISQGCLYNLLITTGYVILLFIEILAHIEHNQERLKQPEG